MFPKPPPETLAVLFPALATGASTFVWLELNDSARNWVLIRSEIRKLSNTDDKRGR